MKKYNAFKVSHNQSFNFYRILQNPIHFWSPSSEPKFIIAVSTNTAKGLCEVANTMTLAEWAWQKVSDYFRWVG